MGEKEEHDEMQQNVCVSMLRNIVRRSHKISNDSFNFLEIFDTISSHNFPPFFPVPARIVFPFQEILFIPGSVTKNCNTNTSAKEEEVYDSSVFLDIGNGHTRRRAQENMEINRSLIGHSHRSIFRKTCKKFSWQRNLFISFSLFF